MRSPRGFCARDAKITHASDEAERIAATTATILHAASAVWYVSIQAGGEAHEIPPAWVASAATQVAGMAIDGILRMETLIVTARETSQRGPIPFVDP